MAHVWLITGGARGLGRAIAEAVLAAGSMIILRPFRTVLAVQARLVRSGPCRFERPSQTGPVNR
jgi:NAD(P)-dependent dehydrogenase (short-subunit alcohol dehydrogenase family)